jgi:3'-5' exoribonuclease
MVLTLKEHSEYQPKGASVSSGNFAERLREEVPYPLTHIPIQEMREGQSISQCFLVKQKIQRVTRTGDPYLEIVLADRTGMLAARAWADATQRYAMQFEQGDFVFVEGRTETYRNALQLIIGAIRRLETHEKETGKILEFDPALLVPTSKRDTEVMWKELCALTESLSPAPLKTLTLELLNSNAESFKTYPAAIQYHHAYLGGLLEHTLEVATGVAQFAAAQPGIDRSLAVAGAILHDIGKLRELEQPISPHHTLSGQLIGHLLLGRDMVYEKAKTLSWPDERLPELLAHIIIAHHGELEFGAAIVPKTAEAITVYHFDNLSAKLNMIQMHIEKDQESGDFTDWHPVLARKFFKGKLQNRPQDTEEGTG